MPSCHSHQLNYGNFNTLNLFCRKLSVFQTKPDVSTDLHVTPNCQKADSIIMTLCYESAQVRMQKFAEGIVVCSTFSILLGPTVYSPVVYLSLHIPEMMCPVVVYLQRQEMLPGMGLRGNRVRQALMVHMYPKF